MIQVALEDGSATNRKMTFAAMPQVGETMLINGSLWLVVSIAWLPRREDHETGWSTIMAPQATIRPA